MDDVFFMEKALEQARISLDTGGFPVGAVLAHEDGILAKAARYGPIWDHPDEVNHAEIIALQDLTSIGWAPHPSKISLYCTLEPCLMCYAALILTGIGRIVYAYEDVMGGGTSCDLTTVGPLYAPQRPDIISGVLRQESLSLFKEYFSSPDNTYWRDSLLAEHALNAY